MVLELRYNKRYETLDLVGRLPPRTKHRVTQILTYNPTLRCYQGEVNENVLNLAKGLNAIIPREVIDAVQASITSGLETVEMKDISTACPKNENLEETVVGLIINHSGLGIGRIYRYVDGVATIDFFSPPSQHQLDIGDINRIQITRGTPCKTHNNNCTIQERIQTPNRGPYIYRVEYDNGLVGELPETELTPIGFVKPREPLDILATLQQDGYPIFAARERLAQTHNEMTRRGAGVRSILSSRIDLHPHQAYVAGTVILDCKQRYLLADEVGLGKTIEAGIVIHDLLAHNPRAKILIICPGTLVQQWFSEMYSKFSGIIFCLPELSSTDSLIPETAQQVILSFHTALTHQEDLIGQQWDLVVIDEVHHLLHMRILYELCKKLSRQDCGLLLLSALPAQHRNQEYYDLLALLEPEQYKPDDSVAREHFSMLFERQREIGGRIGVINRRLAELQEGESKQVSRVIRQLTMLMEIPVLQDDRSLNTSISRLNFASESFINDVHKILHHISDYYRINRRILRNRREKLIESEQLERIQRDRNLLFYHPDQYEIDAISSVERLLKSMRQAKLSENILLPVTKQLFQAATHPTTLLRTLKISEQSQPPIDTGDEYEQLYDFVSYSEWEDQMKYFWRNTHKIIDPELLQEAISCAKSWEEQGNAENGRIQRLISFLEEKHSTQPKDKFLLFAGYPGLAPILAEQLSDHFGKSSITRFYFGLHKDPIQERDLKEKEVRRFRIDRQAWLLICDETGGEGRNFQFASELIHYDLPWQISRIEQRIGRLDRLGRKQTDVVSNLVISKGSKEEAWLECLSNGLEIFTQSISGLEFALRSIELEVAHNLLNDDEQTLWDMPPNIKVCVKEERALDESRNQMDEASYERVRAEEFRRVQSSKEQDQNLANDFTWYFKLISHREGIRLLKQADYPDGVIEFHPEELRKLKLDLYDNKKIRTGTFLRDIAQNRPDLEFFSVGNDFFDSVCRSLSTDPTGRTYAVECIEDLPVWRGFEFSYRVKPSNQLANQDLEYQNFLDHLFAERIEHCFVDENNKLVELSSDLLKLRRSFDKQNKGRIWNNLTKQKAHSLSSYYLNWDKLLRSTEKTAQIYVRERYSKILEPKIKKQLSNLDEQIRILQTAQPSNWRDQVEALLRLKDILATWEIELDTVGFLSINGGVLGA